MFSFFVRWQRKFDGRLKKVSRSSFSDSNKRYKALDLGGYNASYHHEKKSVGGYYFDCHMDVVALQKLCPFPTHQVPKE